MARDDPPQELGPASPERSIFDPSDIVNLSELTLPVDRSPSLSAGHRVAATHRRGLIHGDLRNDRILFNPSTGRTFLVDHTGDHRSDLDPDRMFQDILTVRQRMDDAYFRGFLAGWVRTSYLVTDPGYPGYTNALLTRVGGRILPSVKPAQPVFTEAQCDALLLNALDLDGGFPRIKADLPHGVVPEDDLALVACAILIAGVGGSERLRDATRDATRPLGVVGQLLATLKNELRPDDHGPLLVAAPKALRALDDEAVSPDVLRCLAGMTDITDWLALQLDRSPEPSEAAFINSVRASQLSLMILQHRRWPTSDLESMELKVTSRHRYLNWYSYMLSASPDDPRYLHVFTYLFSRIALYQRMFLVPPPAEHAVGRLWSANWRALSLSCTGLRCLLMAIRSDAVVPASATNLAQVAKMFATRIAQVARDQFLASASVPTFFAPYETRGFSENPLIRLVHSVNDLLRIIENGERDLATIGASDQVSAMLEITDPKLFDDFDQDVSLGIDVEFWERDARQRFGPDWTPRYRRFGD